MRSAAARQKTLTLAGLVTAGLLALALGGTALGDVVWLETGNKVSGEIVEETDTHVIVRTKFGARHVIDREEIIRIERESDPKAEFSKRFEAVSSTDADGFVEVGRWAEERGLKDEARRAYLKAVEIDPGHAPARAALGHRKHRGRWYGEEGYKKAVEGLVRWNGQWVTPSEKAFYEQGFTKNAKGEWVRAEDLARQEADRERRERERAEERRRARERSQPDTGGTTAGGEDAQRPEPVTPRPRRIGPPPPAADPDEDTAWYDDHTTIMSWEEALQRPYESKYYKLYTNIKEEYARRYLKMMDTYSTRGFQKVFAAKKNLPHGVPQGKLYIYPSQQAFMSAEGMGQSVGGYYSGGKVVCYHGSFGATGNTRTVLTHEGTHQFEDFVVPMWNAPIWIIEGFAVFFESAKYDPEKDKVVIGNIPRDRLSNLKHGLATNTLIPLSELIRTPQPSFTGYHYAHAWALCYYMIYGGSKKKKFRGMTQQKYNQMVFSNLFFLSRTKKMLPEDTEELFGGKEGFAAFEEQWKQWLADLPYDFDPATQDFDDIRRDKEKEQGGAGGNNGGGSGQGADDGSTNPRGR
jgi:hypothetical protein